MQGKINNQLFFFGSRFLLRDPKQDQSPTVLGCFQISVKKQSLSREICDSNHIVKWLYTVGAVYREMCPYLSTLWFLLPPKKEDNNSQKITPFVQLLWKWSDAQDPAATVSGVSTCSSITLQAWPLFLLDVSAEGIQLKISQTD